MASSLMIFLSLLGLALTAGFDHDPLWVAPAAGNSHHALAPASGMNNPMYHLTHKPTTLALQGQPGNEASSSKAIKSCAGRSDYCADETDCCEIDKCNIWQHVGRDAAVLLVMYAKWCPVSRDFMLQYDYLKDEYHSGDRVLVAKADAEQNPNLVADFNVVEFPQIILFQRDCYWTPNGCLDESQHFVYNGTANEAEEIRVWVEDTMLYIHASMNTAELPPVPEGPCKVTQTIPKPVDMRPLFQFPQDEGAQLLPRQDNTEVFKMADEAQSDWTPSGVGNYKLAPDETQALEMVPRPLGHPEPNDVPVDYTKADQNGVPQREGYETPDVMPAHMRG